MHFLAPILRLFRSPWTWIIILCILLGLAITGLASLKREVARNRQNWLAAETDQQAVTYEKHLTRAEFKRRLEEDDELREILKGAGVKPGRVNTLVRVKWQTRYEYVPVPVVDTIYLGNPARYARMDTGCTSIEAIFPAGKDTGAINYSYAGSVEIIGYRERPRPRFWNWLKGRWDCRVQVTSPCFPDTAITVNEFIKIE